MRKKRVWRYYCDFCGRGGCAASHIMHHEKGCTANPDRVCGLCAHSIPGEQKQIGVLIEALKSGRPEDGYSAGLIEVRDLAQNCPACILAAIRQSGVQRSSEYDGDGNEIDPGCHVEFDFKKELASWWSDENATQMEHDYPPY